MNTSIKLSEIINDLGNALTAAEWPVKATYHDGRTKIHDTKAIYKELVFASMDAENDLNDLHDCVNELCMKCGQYRREHEGACDGCRWKAVRHND